MKMQTNSTDKDFDVIIIGSGPAGYSAAIRIAQLGGKACIIEREKIGGVCVNSGCIPTKTLWSIAKTIHNYQRILQFDVVKRAVSVDYGKIKNLVSKVVEKSSLGITMLLQRYSIPVLRGHASIQKNQEVLIFEDETKLKLKERLVAKKVIIASGSSSIYPDFIPIDQDIIVSEKLLEMESIPQEIVIVGGGYIGLEYACIFNSLGTKVIVLEMLPQLLSTEDTELSTEILHRLKKSGITILTNTKVKKIKRQSEKLLVECLQQSDNTILELNTQKILLALGRKPNLDEEELTQLGVIFTSQGISTDIHLKTSCDWIYAIGDVNGRWPQAHVAGAEGITAAEDIMGIQKQLDYTLVPTCIFTDPEIASVGIKQGMVGKFNFIANGKALAMNETTGFVKVYFQKGILVGGSIIGPQASDLIAVVQGLLGKSILEIQKLIFGHPTLPEAIFEAVLDAQKNINLPLGQPNKIGDEEWTWKQK